MPKLTKINILTEIIPVNTHLLYEAFNSHKAFGICTDGNIMYAPFQNKTLYIYQRDALLAPEKTLNLQEIFGSKYEVKEEGEHVLIKANNAWQDIIKYNISSCDYTNTSGQVTDFSNEEMEDMGWMLLDFDVTYQEMIDFLEKNVEVTLLCQENNETHSLSYMAYFNDIEITKEVFYTFAKDAIKDKLANDVDFTYDYLDEDQKEAVEYFKAK